MGERLNGSSEQPESPQYSREQFEAWKNKWQETGIRLRQIWDPSSETAKTAEATEPAPTIKIVGDSWGRGTKISIDSGQGRKETFSFHPAKLKCKSIGGGRLEVSLDGESGVIQASMEGGKLQWKLEGDFWNTHTLMSKQSVGLPILEVAKNDSMKPEGSVDFADQNDHQIELKDARGRVSLKLNLDSAVTISKEVEGSFTVIVDGHVGNLLIGKPKKAQKGQLPFEGGLLAFDDLGGTYNLTAERNQGAKNEWDLKFVEKQKEEAVAEESPDFKVVKNGREIVMKSEGVSYRVQFGPGIKVTADQAPFVNVSYQGNTVQMAFYVEDGTVKYDVVEGEENGPVLSKYDPEVRHVKRTDRFFFKKKKAEQVKAEEVTKNDQAPVDAVEEPAHETRAVRTFRPGWPVVDVKKDDRLAATFSFGRGVELSVHGNEVHVKRKVGSELLEGSVIIGSIEKQKSGQVSFEFDEADGSLWEKYEIQPKQTAFGTLVALNIVPRRKKK